MHRIPAIPGGWSPDSQGVIFIEQTPATIVFLTAADTDIQTLAASLPRLPTEFPGIRVANLLQLQQQLSIDSYAERILSHAQVIILRLLGGRSYWCYGLEIVKETVAETEASLFILPGDDRPDPDLMSHSTVPLTAVNRLWRYLTEGGIKNWVNGLKFVTDVCLGTAYQPLPPQEVPKVGCYSFSSDGKNYSSLSMTVATENPDRSLTNRVGILFYRAHYLAGNLLPIDALCRTLLARNLDPIPIFVSSLRDGEVQEALLSQFKFSATTSIQLLLNTTSFSLSKLKETTELDDSTNFWKQLDVPVLQVIFSSGTAEQWKSSFQGLSPRDVAMNVALPEVDGRIITRAVSFKSVETWNRALETEVIIYQPQPDRINFVADLAANWLRLKNTPLPDRKIALILANYPNRNGRLGNGVGLDTPASCLVILKALKDAGYSLNDLPETGDALMQMLTAGVTNDPEANVSQIADHFLSRSEYQEYFASLPELVQKAVEERWEGGRDGGNFFNSLTDGFPIPGIQLGNIFIGIQPSRGYDRDPSLNYHAPDLEPTPAYLAYYYWLRHKFKALAIVHIGKHGNLEWLPGKSIALSETCYPEVALQTLPNFYPFIVNDPGEGAQAKRRSHAVILDHLTPPLTRGELYGDLEKLEGLIDEYYEAQSLDPSRLKEIGDRISQLVGQSHLDLDLGIDGLEASNLPQFLTRMDGYLCELKEAQIRDGLHILGQVPQGKQLRDLITAIARFPGLNRLGLTRGIAQDLNLDFNPLTANLEDQFSRAISPSITPPILRSKLNQARTLGDVVADLEQQATELIENLLENSQFSFQNPLGEATQKELDWIETFLLPALQQTPQEITNLLKGLDGKYVPSGAAGAPTRGRAEVLPTGRNFYSVDIRAIPTETAWDVGRKAAEAVIERYTQENGEYPQTLAISIWGTSTMRTGGDDVAQVLALLGVQPIWDGASRRVVDF